MGVKRHWGIVSCDRWITSVRAPLLWVLEGRLYCTRHDQGGLVWWTSLLVGGAAPMGTPWAHLLMLESEAWAPHSDGVNWYSGERISCEDWFYLLVSSDWVVEGGYHYHNQMRASLS
jgi:hypothetical protein